MTDAEIDGLAREMSAAYGTGTMLAAAPTTRFAEFDLEAAYAVESRFAALRKEAGRRIAGVKVGYANKAVWRKLKLETLVWAHMYDDTVRYAGADMSEVALPYYRSPKLEPEIVFGLKQPLGGEVDAARSLASVDWMAAGFEIIDCPYPDWQFKPADFVAAYGLHLALIVGRPQPVEAEMIPSLLNALGDFKVRVSKHGEFVEEGSGRNALRSPALCVAELARVRPLAAGELISTGTLTSGHPFHRGETWQMELDGLPLAGLTVCPT